MTGSLPRPEHPRPQVRREPWRSLNGDWEFEIDPGRSGDARGLPTGDRLADEIRVPFPPESERSGVEHTDFMPAVWYRRTFDVPSEWLRGRLRLRFEAVDYLTRVWVNGDPVGSHRGGYTPFTLDITEAARPGENVLVLCAEDDVRSGRQPSGKQSQAYESHGVMYSRVTGIWQPVWLEPVSTTHLGQIRLHPDPQDGRIHGSVELNRSQRSGDLTVRAAVEDRTVGSTSSGFSGACVHFSLDLDERHPWTPASPTLYDLELTLRKDGESLDRVETYCGLRSIDLDDGTLLLNGEPIFQRLVLDQGYYPEGIYTAPTDEALAQDIRLAKDMGFNGARLHEKVFEPRFLYHADRLGYLCWGEFGDWGLDRTASWALGRFLPEWLAVIARDYNHPAIVGWTPFNETPPDRDPDMLRTVYRATKAADPTRPVIDTSGYHHEETDLVDIHDYEDDPDRFRERYERIRDGESVTVGSIEESYGPKLSFVSEYGGIWWDPDAMTGWGYGSRPENKAAFLKRYRGLTEALLDNPTISGFCYTQLYDIEQEVNGLYTDERDPKFAPERIRSINEQVAAVEGSDLGSP